MVWVHPPQAPALPVLSTPPRPEAPAQPRTTPPKRSPLKVGATCRPQTSGKGDFRTGSVSDRQAHALSDLESDLDRSMLQDDDEDDEEEPLGVKQEATPRLQDFAVSMDSFPMLRGRMGKLQPLENHLGPKVMSPAAALIGHAGDPAVLAEIDANQDEAVTSAGSRKGPSSRDEPAAVAAAGVPASPAAAEPPPQPQAQLELLHRILEAAHEPSIGAVAQQHEEEEEEMGPVRLGGDADVESHLESDFHRYAADAGPFSTQRLNRTASSARSGLPAVPRAKTLRTCPVNRPGASGRLPGWT